MYIDHVISVNTIARVLFSMLVATMYLATSSTAALHAVSHAASTETEDHASIGITVGSVESDCFICHHGPAMAMIGAPYAPPKHVAAHGLFNVDAVTSAIAASSSVSPPLRAPPSYS